jgi:hypothetical protein
VAAELALDLEERLGDAVPTDPQVVALEVNALITCERVGVAGQLADCVNESPTK